MYGLTVDCSSLEPLVMAAGTVRLRRKKGKFSICGVLSLLGQIKRKLDRIFAGPALKPNCRRKWVWVVGPFHLWWGLGSWVGPKIRFEPFFGSGSLFVAGS
jgi:hypothetical protein